LGGAYYIDCGWHSSRVIFRMHLAFNDTIESLFVAFKKN